LVADVVALIDASGAQRVHLVGHDWGAIVAWHVAQAVPERLISLSALSVPHPAAFVRALLTSRQALLSWYVVFLQLPWLPERIMLPAGPAGVTTLAATLVRSGQPEGTAARDARAMAESGALGPAMNWYRALPFQRIRGVGTHVEVPTMFLYSDGDVSIAAKGAHETTRYVSAPYRFESLAGISHWMIDEDPDAVETRLTDWIETCEHATTGRLPLGRETYAVRGKLDRKPKSHNDIPSLTSLVPERAQVESGDDARGA
jgi:pimeloyl-ACP methyl ester carboxylesterase